MVAESQPSSIEMGETPRPKALENDRQSGGISFTQGTIEPYAEPLPDELDEHEPPEVGRLKAMDVFGFIVNKMVGTGIYTSPVMVLILTGSRKAAIGFWIIGVCYTFVRQVCHDSYTTATQTLTIVQHVHLLGLCVGHTLQHW